MAEGPGRLREHWIDAAKAIGIFLVFYGHLVQFVWMAGVSSAFAQFKIIYSFHIPLFFFMAGFFWKPPAAGGHRVRSLLLRRLLPVWTFGLLSLPLWLLDQLAGRGKIDWPMISDRCLGYLRGWPRLDWITWFLVCLFTCEVLAALLLRRCRSRFAMGGAGLLALAVGLLMAEHPEPVARWFGVATNTWFVHESVVALGFYALGQAVFPGLQALRARRRPLIWAVLVPAAAGVAGYAALANRVGGWDVVMMCLSRHGHPGWFGLAAAAGIVLVIGLAQLAPNWKVLGYLGRNSLVLMGLNGIWFHFLNARLVAAYAPPDNGWRVAVYCGGLTLAALLACVPIVHLANRFIPQLMGRSTQAGPWLPAFE